MPTTQLVVTTLQATALSAASNILAQLLKAYRENVCIFTYLLPPFTEAIGWCREGQLPNITKGLLFFLGGFLTYH